MLATIHDDTWNVLNMQHITPNSKRWDYLDIPVGGHKKIKGPAHMVQGGHHLRKAPNPQPQVRYEVSSVSANSDLCCTSVIKVLYTIACYIRPHSNGIQLYMQ